jgi:transketolase N-terminal domain/subunit
MYCGQGEMGEGEKWEGQMSAISNQRTEVMSQASGVRGPKLET